MDTARRIMKNSFWLIISSLTTFMMGFISVLYLARVLKPQYFGRMNFSSTIIEYFHLIINLGLPMLAVREAARNIDKLQDFAGHIMTIRFLLSLLSMSLLGVFLIVVNLPGETKLLILLYGFGLLPTALGLDWTFQAMEKMIYVSILTIVGTVLNISLVFIFIKGPDNLYLIPVFQFIVGIMILIAILILFVKKVGFPRFHIDTAYWKALIQQALPIGLSLLLVKIYQGIDVVMLGFMKGEEQVGYYNAAFKPVSISLIIIGAYCNAIFPVMSNYFKTSLESLKRLLQITTRLLITVSMPVVIGGIIVADQIILLLYGPGYEKGVIAFQVLIWVIVLISLNVARSWGLLACNRQKQHLVGSVIASVTNITLNFILIPLFGLVGAGIATVAAEAVVTVVYHYMFRKVLVIEFLKPTLKPLIASVLMGALVYLCRIQLQFNLFVLIGIGVASYSVIIVIIKGITFDEIMLVKDIVFKRTKEA